MGMAGWQRVLERILTGQRIQSLRATPRKCPVRQETMRLTERPHQVTLPSSTLSSDITLLWHRQYGLKKKKEMEGNQDRARYGSRTFSWQMWFLCIFNVFMKLAFQCKGLPLTPLLAPRTTDSTWWFSSPLWIVFNSLLLWSSSTSNQYLLLQRGKQRVGGEANWLAWVVQSCLVKPSEASGSSGVEAYGTSLLWKNSFGLKSLKISVFKWHVVWMIAFGKTTERKNESRITAFGIERRKWG